jgi:large subunit ribosomal protein L9
MEIILVQDMPKLGNRGDVVRVKDGYARNYLFPRNLAMKATDSNKRHVAEIIRQTRARMEKQKVGAEELRNQLDGEHIKFTLAFGDTGKAYGSVTSKDISQAFRDKGIYFDHHQVMLDHSLKDAGAHDVQIRLFKDVFATVKVWVVPEGEAPQEPTIETRADEPVDGEQAAPAAEENADQPDREQAPQADSSQTSEEGSEEVSEQGLEEEPEDGSEETEAS